MIAARKGRWFNAWFARHARGRIEGTFGRVLVRGLEATTRLTKEAPVLVVANHSTWWDALVALHASERLLGADGYALMDAANLRRLPFFRRVGAFGVDLEDPADGARAIRYAAKLLDRPGRLVWVFPQGREHSPHAPLELLPGAAQIAKVARRATVLPVGLRYVFGASEAPDLFVSFGEPLTREESIEEGVLAQRAGIERELVRIDTTPGELRAITARSPSTIGRLAERTLAWMFP